MKNAFIKELCSGKGMHSFERKTMFEILNSNKDSYVRIRKLAIISGAVSLLFFMATVIWVEIRLSKYEDCLLPIYPTGLEQGLVLGALLGMGMAIGLFVLSLDLQFLSEK
jgi:hypothetical protein